MSVNQLIVLLFLFSVGPQVSRANELDFTRDVRPIFSENCFHCHGFDAKARKADLRMDDETSAKKFITPGDAAKSELLQRLETDDPEELMPPKKSHRSLTQTQIETVRQWINQGARWGGHWAFQPVPQVEKNFAGQNPVDFFVDQKLARENLSPNLRADRHILIRRASLDLTGLPPTPREVKAFLEDKSGDAWEKVIDQLLASPRYGERMAWDWLDVARYGDSNGYQGDRERSMWPWRDWVVSAFNRNLPYDQFTVWQLAGDLLENATEEQILATGFCRNHMINGEGGRIAEENRVDYVFDMTETMATVWLGLTLNCCRCHDHKFDPLTQKEYYQLTAFFNQTPVNGGGGDPQTQPVLTVATEQQKAKEKELAARFEEARKAEAAWFKMIAPKQAEWERTYQADKGDAAIISAIQIPSDKRTKEQAKLVRDAFRATDPLLTEDFASSAAAAKAALDAHQQTIPKVMVMGDMSTPRKTYLLNQGLYDSPRDEVQAAVPAFLSQLDETRPANRLALARWLVSIDHPLMARVTINRFWQMIFGTGLVKTVEDFGVQSEYPVHPELLDWLAGEFMASGWDLKHLLRTILTSETYQRSSHLASPDQFDRDPLNRLLARGARFRMPSWMIRDQALAVSGLRNPAIGGPGFNGYQPPGIWEEATFGNKKYIQATGDDLYRRSLYVFWRRIVGPTVFFAAGKRQVCEVQIARTNTPMHALTTLNDVTYVEAARHLAEVAMKAATNDTERFALISHRVLARDPGNRELDIWRRNLARNRTRFRDAEPDAKALLKIGGSKRDESLNPSEHAAWTNFCLMLLNLDETLNKE